MLTRWDPFREMLSLRNSVDRLFDEPFVRRTGGWEPVDWGLPLDVIENEDEYLVKASLPGINPNDLDITYAGNTLTIKGEIKPEEIEQSRYHLQERRFGRFTRSVTLPDEVDANRIEASYDAGVLTLRLPKVEEVKPKRIQVQSGASQKMIEGKVKEAVK